METAILRQYITQLVRSQLPVEKRQELSQALETMDQEELAGLFPEDEWRSIAPLLMSQERVDRSFEQLQQHLQEETPVVPIIAPRRTYRVWWPAACVAILAVTLGWLLLRKSGDAATDWKEVATVEGQQKMIRLEDGTVLHLNGGSRLQVPAEFAATYRQVKLLQGEVFAEVSHDAQRPFTINTGDMEVRVLGTSFNVRNYPREEAVAVGVRTGRVAVHKTGMADTTLLLPGLQGVFEKATAAKQVLQLRTEAIAGWQQRSLVFDNASLATILRELEHTYGVNFEVRQPAHLRKQFNAAFRQRTLDDIMRQLSILGDFQYTRKDTLIIIQ